MNEWEKDTYICTHSFEEPEKHQRSIVPPIYESSVHVYETYEAFLHAQQDEQNNYLYWRGTNPTVEIAERKIAELERGESCKCFTSGMAAISAAILALLKSGDHIITIGNVYGTSQKLIHYLNQKWSVDYTTIYQPSLEELEKAIQPNTSVILFENPSTMTFQTVDITEIVTVAKKNHIKTIIDNTWATPLFQKPLLLGVDVVVHSAAKYLSGHSDILAGAVISNKEIIKQIFDNEFTLFGGALAPYEAWLLLRGMRTLPIRMKQHEQSGLKVANFLQNHSAVKKVNHPSLYFSDKTHSQFKGYSGVFSFELKENTYEKVKTVINELSIFQIGYSFGSYESLVLSENNGSNDVELMKKGIDPGLIRLSVGLESPDLLISDIEGALSKL